MGPISNQVQRKGLKQFNQLESKYHCLEAILGCITFFTSKTMLCEWSSTLLHEKKSLRKLSTIWCPAFFDATQLHYDVDSDVAGGDCGASSSDQGGTSNVKSPTSQVRFLLETHDNLSLNEEDYLHTLLAVSFKDGLPPDLLFLRASRIVSMLQRHVAHASDKEVSRLLGILVEFTKRVRAHRNQNAQIQGDKQRKGTTRKIQGPKVSPNPKPPKQTRVVFGSGSSSIRALALDSDYTTSY